MNKISPSERISNEIKQLLQEGITGETELKGEDLLSVLFNKTLKKVFQEILETEVKDYLGRDYYQREKEIPQQERIYRNGYENKNYKTSFGKIAIEQPQLRNTETPYRSGFLQQIRTISPELEKLVTEMYVRGLSTRDIEEVLRAEDGKLLISRSGVSEITQTMTEQYKDFIKRDLSEYDVVYLYADGVYENFRSINNKKEAILCSWGILATGEKIMLHLAVGNKESYECWKEFFQDMLDRGLRYPLLTVSDGAPGLIRALEECFPESERQRCIAHKLRNISNKLSDYGREELLPEIREVYYQSDKEIAKLIAGKIIEKYSNQYPSAIKCFQQDFDQTITFMRYPKGHHIYIRTTNVLERAFEESRRRTKVIPRFFNETSCINLTYSTLIRVSEKWKRIKMNDYELTLLKKLRDLFGWKEDKEGFISKKYAA